MGFLCFVYWFFEIAKLFNISYIMYISSLYVYINNFIKYSWINIIQDLKDTHLIIYQSERLVNKLINVIGEIREVKYTISDVNIQLSFLLLYTCLDADQNIGKCSFKQDNRLSLTLVFSLYFIKCILVGIKCVKRT